MKKKIIVLAATAIIMAVALAGCGVKITNIAVPESAMVEKGESITLPVVYGTDDAPAVTPETAATGESAATDEKVAKLPKSSPLSGPPPMRVLQRLMRPVLLLQWRPVRRTLRLP